MTPEKWKEILERSDNLRAVRQHNESAARSAIRVVVHAEAQSGLGPVGVVDDARFLLPSELQ